MPKSPLVAKTLPAIAALKSTDWDACANPKGQTYHPFVSYAFLHALEASGSAVAETGWQPQHIVLEDKGKLCAALPLYAKSHSQGEYVFDHAWGEALMRAGADYYPKLLTAVPFTPATGPRFLLAKGQDRSQRQKQLIAAVLELCQKTGCSSWHCNFVSQEDWQACGALGLLQRTDQQFHWRNDGYKTFDDFLASLASRKRKNIRKERQMPANLTIKQFTGADITQAHWDSFFGFYMDTGARKWGQPYLTRDFFTRIGKAMAKDILLVLAFDGEQAIAGALNFIGGDTLYGRYWGCSANYKFLHFELCYYQAIDYAIARKLACVEAGAQGPHKLARGYVPTQTFSVHHIAHTGLRAAVDAFLKSERKDTDYAIKHLQQYTPFKQENK